MANSHYHQPGPQIQLHYPVSGPPTAVSNTATPHVPYLTHPSDYFYSGGIPTPQPYPGTQYIAWHIKYYICALVSSSYILVYSLSGPSTSISSLPSTSNCFTAILPT